MNLGEKIMMLRKKQGLSQEELAYKLDVSRQSVSKWESNQSTPDINKLIILSEMFGVSVDYLLKEDTLDSEITVEQAVKRTSSNIVSKELAREYLKHSKRMARLLALGITFFVLSSLPMMIFLANKGYKPFSMTISLIISLVIFFVLVIFGVGLMIFVSFKNQTYKYIYDDDFLLGDGVTIEIENSKNAYAPKFMLSIIIGVTLCVLSIIPTICFSLLLANFVGFGVAIMLMLVDVAIVLFVYSTTQWFALQRLLREGEFTKENRQVDQLNGKIGGIYWPLVIAIYLAYSFITGDWDRSWVVWPVSSVLFAVVTGIASVFVKKSKVQ